MPAAVLLSNLNRQIFLIEDSEFFQCNYKDIPVVSKVTQQQVLDNYYQVKMDIKRLIGEEVGRLKAEKN